jgi:hypothetical protein
MVIDKNNKDDCDKNNKDDCDKNNKDDCDKNNKDDWFNKHTIFLFIGSIIIGFIILYFINYKPNRIGYRLQELILLIEKNCYHIHHFISCCILILTLLVGRYVRNIEIITIIIGFLIGVSLEDLLFKDWDLIKNNCHKKKLIKYIRHT